MPQTKKFHADLNGLQEVPAVSSTGFGTFDAELVDDDTLHFVFHYDGLEGGTSLFAHVHFGARFTERRRVVLPLRSGRERADRRART